MKKYIMDEFRRLYLNATKGGIYMKEFLDFAKVQEVGNSSDYIDLVNHINSGNKETANKLLFEIKYAPNVGNAMSLISDALLKAGYKNVEVTWDSVLPGQTNTRNVFNLSGDNLVICLYKMPQGSIEVVAYVC